MRPANKVADELLMLVRLREDRSVAGRIRPVAVSAAVLLFSAVKTEPPLKGHNNENHTATRPRGK
jgi:hypothetical protein